MMTMKVFPVVEW